MKKIAAVIAGILLCLGMAVPANATPSTTKSTISVSVVQVKKIRPGAFCKKSLRGHKAKAKNGHTYKCKFKGKRLRWVRA